MSRRFGHTLWRSLRVAGGSTALAASLLLFGSNVSAQDDAADDKPAEEPAAAAEEKPSEEKPAEDQPADAEKPADATSADEKPAAEDKPAEDKPADAPTEDKPAEEKPAEEKPAEEKPAEEKPTSESTPAATAKPVDAAVAQQAFNVKLDEWKELLKELRAVQSQYQIAKDNEIQVLQEQWTSLIDRGHALLPELRETGLQAYRASPNTDRVLLRFLVKMLDDEIQRDNYEPALALAQPLIENDCPSKEIYNAAGIAAFATNDFEAAEKYLQKAQQFGVLTDVGRNYFGVLPEYKELWKKEQAKREAEAAADDLPRVKLATSEGDIVIELFENEAPETVGNFVSLVEHGFYDGLSFHRVLQGFMAQGGDPQGDGTGGPGYNIYCECEKEDHRDHFRGTLSMAHAGRDTGGSQFFLTFVPTPHLNGQHTAFGRVIKGMDVLARLHRIDPSSPDAAVEPSKIVRAEVLRKREHEYKPNKVE
ncbi:MAG: peptidylprolyl isomerase [Pirellulaceae bacterium]